MENIFAKGGKTKVKYDYIPQKAIDELSYTIDKVTKGISGDKLLSGVYVKSDAKSKTKSGSNLTAKILAMTDDEDKKEVILEKDVKEFQKYISDKLITAFYLGLPLAYDFKGDYSYGGGVITMVVDDAKRKTTQAIKNAKNKKFELGLKYPQYDFEKLLGKPIIKDVFGKTMTFDDGTTEKYQYRLWIWKDCVIGQTIGSENSSRGFKDFTYGEKPTLMGGYKSVQTSKESKLESIINFMAKDKDGFVKDNNVLYNGLGGANFETLEVNKIKYAKGGEVVGLSISRLHSDFPKGFENSGEVIKKGNSKWKVENGILLRKVGSGDWKEWRKITYAKGGKTKRSKHSLMQDRRRISSEPWEVAYQKRKSKMEAGGTLPTPFGQAGLVGETGAMNEMELFAMGGGLPQGVHQYYANTYNPAYPTPHGYAKGGEITKTGNKGSARWEMKITDDEGNTSSIYAETKSDLLQYKKMYLAKGGEIKMEEGNKIYALAESLTELEKDKLLLTLNEKETEKFNTLIQLGDSVNLALISTLVEESPQYRLNWLKRQKKSSVSNLSMAKGGSIKVGDKVKYPKATMVGKVKSIKDSDFERTLTIEYDDGKIINEGESSVIKFAKGGMTDVERQSMIDMGYSEEQIKEVEDNPRRGGRFAKGGKTQGSKLLSKIRVGNIIPTNKGNYEIIELQEETGNLDNYDGGFSYFKVKDENDKVNYIKISREKNPKMFINDKPLYSSSWKNAKQIFAKGGKTKSSGSKRRTPMSLAKEIRKEGEKWQDAVKRASAILKKKAK